MARRNDHSREQLREMALTAAREIVSSEGLTGLSVRKIAAQIGYSPGSLYQLFENLDDLCWQINAITLNQLLEQLAQVTGDSPVLKLNNYASCYLEFAVTKPGLWGLLFEHQSRAGKMPVELGENIDRLFALIELPLSELRGHQTDQESSQAARTLWAAVHGVVVLHRQDKLFSVDLAGAEVSLVSLIDIFTRGWQGENHA